MLKFLLITSESGETPRFFFSCFLASYETSESAAHLQAPPHACLAQSLNTGSSKRDPHDMFRSHVKFTAEARSFSRLISVCQILQDSTLQDSENPWHINTCNKMSQTLDDTTIRCNHPKLVSDMWLSGPRKHRATVCKLQTNSLYATEHRRSPASNISRVPPVVPQVFLLAVFEVQGRCKVE